MRNWTRALREESRYIGMSTVVFIVSAIMGYLNTNGLLRTLKAAGIFDQLEQIAKSIDHNPTFLHAFLTIFANNLLASVTMIGLGLLLGLVPFFSMLTNGLMLGVTLHLAASESHASPLFVFLTTILPHGIVELPAAILAAAFGIHLGMAVLRRFFSFVSPVLMERSKEEWQGIRRRIIPILLTIVSLLLIAALIEASLILYVKPLG
ncbi:MULTISPECIES: stage II sporulation protein M [Thermoactinomyces]|jgi:stage II sporulation protein M|uniref:Stage II sporulation protein M n=1 Tax=Thermoactinomyces daqus TaxID=1329516 RepID=A0A7W1X972_9BACL|nr:MULTISPECIES: stage II sporulation protein M [Thermoactinomyces]MBA4542315.1 stage II sporulation protein M [Thermoactinomyces daqus]MBH8604883.1 stage II sporulation protein M [Thermoactinomyces sp. CICC 10522]MBH8607291.1 stage II sporulation protein M [Thermoactinomyces sp. CICC 10521]